MDKPKNNFSKIKSGKSESNSGGSLWTGGRKAKESDEFYQQLQRVIDKVNKNDFLVIAG